MEIRFVSTLAPEEENRIASVVIDLVRSLLERFPMTYSLRITTSDSKVFQDGHSADSGNGPLPDQSPSRRLHAERS